jgi:hypothetical protein
MNIEKILEERGMAAAKSIRPPNHFDPALIRPDSDPIRPSSGLNPSEVDCAKLRQIAPKKIFAPSAS